MGRVRQLWKEGKQAIGYWSALSDPMVTTILVNTKGMDFGVSDFQHGFHDVSNAPTTAHRIISAGLTPLARVCFASESGRLLDLGYEGIICPMIQNEDDVEEFVKSCYYQPSGTRSWGPAASLPFRGESMLDYFHHFRPITFAMIETLQAIDRVEAICSHPQLDGIFVGPSDLSVCLGEPFQGHTGKKSQEVMRMIEEVAKKKNKKLGIYCPDGKTAALYKNRGYDFITCIHDRPNLASICQSNFQEFDSAPLTS